MKQVTTILGELLKIFPRYKFGKLEHMYYSNHYTKYYTGWQQFITLLFAQIGGQDSLRGIETHRDTFRKMVSSGPEKHQTKNTVGCDEKSSP